MDARIVSVSLWHERRVSRLAEDFVIEMLHITKEDVYKRQVYAHCLSLTVHAGQSVKQGQLIGYVGSTGRSSGNHCHFEILLNGSYIPPQRFFPGKK